MSGNLGCVIVAVDSSEESMNALRWALDNVKLRSTEPRGFFVILHVQSPPSIAAGLNSGAIPFGGPSDLEVPAFTAAIEKHQGRISDAIIAHALQICSDKNVKFKAQVVIGDPKVKICEVVEDMHADLLVIGCRAFSPIRRAVKKQVGITLTGLHAHQINVWRQNFVTPSPLKHIISIGSFKHQRPNIMQMVYDMISSGKLTLTGLSHLIKIPFLDIIIIQSVL